MTFPLGATIELQHDANVIRQHRDLDLAAQAAQAERHHSLPPGHGLTAVLALMEGDGVDDAEMYFTPFRPVAQLTLPLRHLRLRSSQKSRGPLPKQATLRPRGERLQRKNSRRKTLECHPLLS